MIDSPSTVRTESAADLRLVLDALAVGVLALDADGVVRVANRVAAAALEAGAQELIGERLAALLPEYVAPADPGASARVLRRGAGGEAQALLVAEQALSESASPIRRLITLHPLAGCATERDPRSGLPVDATTRIVGGLAHELRNPLASVQALAEVLLAGLTPVDARHECATRIRREVARIESFVRAALRLTQLAPGQAAPHDPLALIAAARALAAQPGGVRIAAPPDPAPRCLCDREQIVECLAALLVNAHEASPSTDGVGITVERSADLAGRPWVRFTVDDDGCGIPPRLRLEVFEPFFTTKAGRLGFGLALARRQAAINGGRLELAPAGPLGSRFELWLPGTAR